MSDAKHTEHAMQAVDLGELFNLFMGSDRLDGGETSYRLELSVPDAGTTAGGKQARQNISLVPEAGGAMLVMGSANKADGQASLRTYEHVAHIYGQRFAGQEFQVQRSEFEIATNKLHKFLEQQGMTVVVEEFVVPTVSDRRPLAVPTPKQAAKAAGGLSPTVLMAGIIAAVVAGVIAYVLVSK